MHHRRKRRVNLHRDVFALKSNRIRHLVTVDVNANQRRIDQFDFNFVVASFERYLFLRFCGSAVLHFFDDKFHLGFVERTVGLRPTIANRIRHAFDQFAGDTYHDALRLQASLFFGGAESLFAVAHDPSDISIRPLLHIAQLLMRPPDTDDFNILARHLRNQRLDVFSSNVQPDDIFVRRRRRLPAQLSDSIKNLIHTLYYILLLFIYEPRWLFFAPRVLRLRG